MIELFSNSIFNSNHESFEDTIQVFLHALLTYLPAVALFTYSLLGVSLSSRGVKPAIAFGQTLLETEKHNSNPIEAEENAIDRADRQPNAKPNNYWNTKPTPFAAVSSVDDGNSYYESTFGSTSGYFSDANYSGHSYKSQIAISGPSNTTQLSTATDRRINLVRSNFKGETCVPDKDKDLHVEQGPVPDIYENNGSDRLYDYYSSQKSQSKPPGLNDVHLDSKNSTTPREIQSSGINTDHAVIANDSLKTRKDDKVTSATKGYSKLTYTVLIGNSVKVYNTTMASNPHYDKFIVKERYKDTSGITKTKLALKSKRNSRYIAIAR